jgi:hypothetical protein
LLLLLWYPRRKGSSSGTIERVKVLCWTQEGRY